MSRCVARVAVLLMVIGCFIGGLALTFDALTTVSPPTQAGIVTVMARPSGASASVLLALDRQGQLTIEVSAPRRAAHEAGGTTGDIAIAVTGDISLHDPKATGDVTVYDNVDCGSRAVLLGRCDQPVQLFIFRPTRTTGVPHLVTFGRVTGRPARTLMASDGGELAFAAPYLRLLPLPGDVDLEPETLALPDLAEAQGPASFGRPNGQLSELAVVIDPRANAETDFDRWNVHSASPALDRSYAEGIFVWGSCASDDICPDSLEPRAAVPGGLISLERADEARRGQIKLLAGGVLLGAFVPESIALIRGAADSPRRKSRRGTANKLNQGHHRRQAWSRWILAVGATLLIWNRARRQDRPS
jgi:hypothetical protein